MVVLPGPLTFQMGSPESEPKTLNGRESDEHLHLERLDRSIAVATKEITVLQFERFLMAGETFRAEDRLKRDPSPGEDPWKRPVKSPTKQSAMTAVSLKEAMLYCWWLTKQEGIADSEQCYEYSPGENYKQSTISTREGYLEKTGYRLPTEAEWEFVCRSGTTTSRFFGTDESLMDRYAWFRTSYKDQARPPGLLRPNRFGVFDMLGNVREYCQERYHFHYASRPRDERIVGIESTSVNPDEGKFPTTRGGSFIHSPNLIRCAMRIRESRFSRQPDASFRVVRTMPKTKP